MNTEFLASLIGLPTVDNNGFANLQAIHIVREEFARLNFSVRIEGEELTDQPTVIGHYPGRNSDNKIVIYGHYDVARVDDPQQWMGQSPFVIQEHAERLYARGIADNKGPLAARFSAFADLLQSDLPIPEILWLIQGEEEVANDNPVAKAIFKTAISTFGGKVFIEETGFNDLDTQEQIAFLWSPDKCSTELSGWRSLLNKTLDCPRIEFRHLNKFNGIPACPLLSNLPDDAVYIGFGPNDRLHQIHRNNESLSKVNLSLHAIQFRNFLADFATFCDCDR